MLLEGWSFKPVVIIRCDSVIVANTVNTFYFRFHFSLGLRVFGIEFHQGHGGLRKREIGFALYRFN